MIAGYDNSARIFGVTEGACICREENAMPKRVVSYVAAVAAGLCTVIAFSTNWALASGGCVMQPNRQLAQGGHWYYRVDRVNYRKCWYLVEPGTRILQAEAPEARSSPDAATFSSFSSFFSLLSADFMGAKTARVQQNATNSGVRTLEKRSDDLKNGDGSWVKRSRIARHSRSSTALSAPRGESMDQPPPLGQAERDHLFQEFLQWNARQAP
jgi:hypothetical protein